MNTLLKGKCFISTRPIGKSEELGVLLNQNGADLYEFPMIELAEIVNDESYDEVLDNYTAYTHIAFTSAYGFEFFYKKVSKQEKFQDFVSKIKIASFGYKTSEIIRSYGVSIDFDANARTGEEFADKFIEYLKGKDARVIWATGSLSPNNLLDRVNEVAKISRINLYTNSFPKNVDNGLMQKIKQQDYDMIVLASPSAFKNLSKLVDAINLKVVCIGQTTASEVKKHGVIPLAVAEEPNAVGLINAIKGFYKDRKLTIKN